ncbi:hypothetical protein [Alicyclobacillus fructus]|uniref:hypothetical protein n=1 Tax=Alicyclobacillus fructus TaxID=2816082 RepID=UPI001F44E2B2|nr:hypothetical protein [Alicyclobacillus fructus]
MLHRARTCLVGLAVTSLILQPGLARAAAGPQPVPVGFYYGWVTPETGADIQGYQAIVLGSDSESSGYPNQQAVTQLIASSPSIAFYGYVNLSDGSNPIPVSTLSQEFAEWKALGVRGIFLDLAGSNYGVTRVLRAWAVAQVHALGMRAAVNAWDPADALGVGLGLGDVYVAEDWYMASRQPAVEYPNNAPSRDLAVLNQLASQGVGVWAVTQESQPTPSITAQEVASDVQAMRKVIPMATGLAVGGSDYGAETNAIVPASAIASALAMGSAAAPPSSPSQVQNGASFGPSADAIRSKPRVMRRVLVPAVRMGFRSSIQGT